MSGTFGTFGTYLNHWNTRNRRRGSKDGSGQVLRELALLDRLQGEKAVASEFGALAAVMAGPGVASQWVGTGWKLERVGSR